MNASLDLATTAPAKTLLDALKAGIATYQPGGPILQYPLDHLDPANAAIVSEVLGSGEVSVMLEDGTRIQEAVMPGLWRVATADSEYLEVADIPSVVRQAMAATRRDAPVIPEAPPEGAMNVMPVLVEIADGVAKIAASSPFPDAPAVEINLSLLPMTPVDLTVLYEALGLGGVTILSRGYGNCRIQSLGCRHVWRINFFNSDDKLILDTIEVGDVPKAALASAEDIAENVERLAGVMEAYF